MNKTSIIVKHTFDGFHYWSQAPVVVAWLRLRHHHKFVVRAEIEVTHADRELEYFMVGNEIEKWCNQLKPVIAEQGWSCEMICNKLIECLREKYGERDITLTVHEDDNHGSKVVYSKVVSIL